MPEKNISDQLRALLPQATPEVTSALDKVAQLEHEHRAAMEQARIERAFLERAAREGLLYPGDALKLDDVLPKLKVAADETAMAEVFRQLRTQRPYLFARPNSPANQKLSEHDPESLRGALKHGSLTRQVQELRRRKR
jgi:hypothetical protein